MALDLPGPIHAYFDSKSAMDVDAILAPFAVDAIVHDENNEYRGTDEIRAWIAEASVGNKVVTNPLTIESDGDQHRVRAEIAGDFKGSPVTLSYNFILKDDRIAALDIG